MSEIAELKGLDREFVEDTVFRNTVDLFRLPIDTDGSAASAGGGLVKH